MAFSDLLDSSIVRMKGVFGDLRFAKRKRWLLLFWPTKSLVLALIGWIVLSGYLEKERAETEANAVHEAGILSRAYSNHLFRGLEAVDQLTLYIKYGWETSNGNFRPSKFRHPRLQSAESGFYVSLIDRNGNLLSSTIPSAARVNIADESYFRVHMEKEDLFHIGTARIGNFSKTPVVPFSRRLSGEDGSFRGIVLVSVTPDYFTSAYDEITLKAHGFFAILSADEKVRLARIGETIFLPDEESQAMLKKPVLNEWRSGRLLDGKEWFVDGRSRYVGWQATFDYGMITMAGLDQEAVLAPYHAWRKAVIGNALAGTGLLALITLIAMGVSLHLAWRKHQIEMVQATYRTATEVGNEGFVIARPLHDERMRLSDFQVIDCNDRAAQLLGIRRNTLLGATISALYQGEAAQQAMKMMTKAMNQRFFEGDIDLHRVRLNGPQWLNIRVSRPENDLAITMRDISEMKAHVAELEKRGNEDALTGLPNRHWLNTFLPAAVERAAQDKAMLALLFLDLDGFKTVNDTMGHDAGDDILRNVARRLEDAVRPHDRVARIGGDEFLVILEPLEHADDAAQVAERILNAFRSAFRISKGVVGVGVSIGISVFPKDGTDATVLLNNADMAMYSVKTSGKRNYCFFDAEFSERLRARHQYEMELRYAIEHDQLVVHYQPRVSMANGITTSMEALVRWHHPTRGLVEPSEFIPLAEEAGLIARLGERVIDKVCAQLAFWARHGRHVVPVSVNVSALHFQDADPAQTLASCIARHGIDPGLIEVELTESSMMGDSETVASAIRAIRNMGITLLVDDFGTGYSSLSQLQRMDFDVLKVDRAFTAQLEQSREGTVFYTAIITMAHSLGMKVVAEGVESIGQARVLKSLECDEIQGYFVSRPLPPSEVQPLAPQVSFA
ncbi:EAL domain-containing protein [Noviherbaspirillum sp. CPCC 100848]|uniref:EAL domain-containing protein n=1 Tax=Noviherbaspirillum album TaxID=3080276 RepID=A0ABU6JHD6_9BURK|nr:EAL domain-containing protein [Noviherbaspirillum sp. CPCC 100848]MEC4723082.1 EAL domain-containing protein [Noviherbaspirillum sp. CPCC 100848]